VVYIVVYINL